MNRVTRSPAVARARVSDRGARRTACPAPTLETEAPVPFAAGAAERRAARRQTLDELLVGAWEDLRTASATDCPVCGGTMLSRRGAGPVVGECAGCRAVMS